VRIGVVVAGACTCLVAEATAERSVVEGVAVAGGSFVAVVPVAVAGGCGLLGNRIFVDRLSILWVRSVAPLDRACTLLVP